MNRKRQQAQLAFQLVSLVGPLRKMAQNPDSYDKDERTAHHCPVFRQSTEFNSLLAAFGNGEPGHRYLAQTLAAQAVALEPYQHCRPQQ